MKKFIIFLICQCLILNINFNLETSKSYSQSTTYAKALSGCLLYKDESLESTLDNVYFVVPETYFVSVIEVVSNNCLKVQYRNFVGFVESSTVVIATFIPNVKNLEGITCDIKATSGTQIWSEPSSKSEIYTTIPAKTKGINYISFAYGEIPSGGESNLWFYVTYTPESNSTSVYEGYVYSENITNLSEIIANPETNPLEMSEGAGDESVIVISPSIRTLLVALISVPIIVLFAIILFKIVKKLGEKRKKVNNFAENENPVVEENNDYFQDNFGGLKKQIANLKNACFVKKNKNQFRSNQPVFPSYDSDDDLL